jgi:hypothetical protein
VPSLTLLIAVKLSCDRDASSLCSQIQGGEVADAPMSCWTVRCVLAVPSLPPSFDDLATVAVPPCCTLQIFSRDASGSYQPYGGGLVHGAGCSLKRIVAALADVDKLCDFDDFTTLGAHCDWRNQWASQ